jgi:hypothetical protein
MAPGKGTVIATPAYFMTAGPFPECPGEKLCSSGARDRSRTAETLHGSVHKSPLRLWPHAHGSNALWRRTIVMVHQFLQ